MMATMSKPPQSQARARVRHVLSASSWFRFAPLTRRCRTTDVAPNGKTGHPVPLRVGTGAEADQERDDVGMTVEGGPSRGVHPDDRAGRPMHHPASSKVHDRPLAMICRRRSGFNPASCQLAGNPSSSNLRTSATLPCRTASSSAGRLVASGFVMDVVMHRFGPDEDEPAPRPLIHCNARRPSETSASILNSIRSNVRELRRDRWCWSLKFIHFVTDL